MGKMYMIVNKEDGKVKILCIEGNTVTEFVVERDDGDYEYRKIKASELI